MDKNSIRTLSTLIQARVPVMLVSSPGRAKTSIVEAIGRKLNLPVYTYLLSLREPVDLIGFPVRDTDGETTRHLPPREFVNLIREQNAILFLDELTTAPPSIQKVALRMVEERVVGELALPPGVSIVAAGNPPDQAVDGYELGMALANRFTFLDWSLDIDQWQEYMLSGDRGTLPSIPVLPKDWRDRIPAWRAKVLGFVKAKRELLEVVPRDETTMSWASPRSWDKAAIGLAAADAANADDEVRSLIVTGAVGKGAGLEFLNWIEHSDLPDPEILLKKPSSWKVSSDAAMTYATVVSLVAAVSSRVTDERWSALWACFSRIPKDQKDIPAIVMPTLAKIRDKNDLPIPDEIIDLMSLVGGIRS